MPSDQRPSLLAKLDAYLRFFSSPAFVLTAILAILVGAWLGSR